MKSAARKAERKKAAVAAVPSTPTPGLPTPVEAAVATVPSTPTPGLSTPVEAAVAANYKNLETLLDASRQLAAAVAAVAAAATATASAAGVTTAAIAMTTAADVALEQYEQIRVCWETTDP